jgi:NitT/TauT family transport system substrate-binding protein
MAAQGHRSLSALILQPSEIPHVRVTLRMLAVVFALAAVSLSANAADQKQLVVAEPVHNTAYLPLYIAVDKGYFADEGLDVKVLTVEGGSAHTNAVLTGQAYAFIGGPEHDAFAKLKGAELRSIVNIADRGNNYLVAAVGKGPHDKDDKIFTAYFKGKSIVTSQFGGTPNSTIRYMIAKAGLDVAKDMTLLETTTPGILAAVKAGQAQIAITSEPFLTQGVRQSVWEEPFYNVPKEMGPYAYSTLNVQLQSIQKDPDTARGVVRAMIRALRFTYAHPDEAAAIAHKEFPTMPPDDLKATLDRCFADEMWSHDGMVSEQSWTTAQSVVRAADILKADVPYDAIIDMRFVKEVLASNPEK